MKAISLILTCCKFLQLAVAAAAAVTLLISTMSGIVGVVEAAPCNLTRDCNAQAWKVTGDTISGCSCSCGYGYAEACTTDGICAKGGLCQSCSPGFVWFPSMSACTRGCDKILDCNENAWTASGFTHQGCVCDCRNKWLNNAPGQESNYTTKCSYCPVQYATPKSSGDQADCDRCADGFQTVSTSPLKCTRPCQVKQDCFEGRAYRAYGEWPACKCDCWHQYEPRDVALGYDTNCRFCAWPHNVSANCSQCVEGRSPYPKCFGECSIPLNCSNTTASVSRNDNTGECNCNCRNLWETPKNLTQEQLKANLSLYCSFCPKNGVEHRDCVPKTPTHELTETKTITSTSTSSSTQSISNTITKPTLSPSFSDPTPSETASGGTRTFGTFSRSNSFVTDSHSYSNTELTQVTVSDNSFTSTKSASLSVEPTKTETIVVCFMRDCDIGANHTYYHKILRRCVCVCKNYYAGDRCETCPISMRPDILNCTVCSPTFFNNSLIPGFAAPPSSGSAISPGGSSSGSGSGGGGGGGGGINFLDLTTTTSTTTTTTTVAPTSSAAISGGGGTTSPSGNNNNNNNNNNIAAIVKPNPCDCATHTLLGVRLETEGAPWNVTRYVEQLALDIHSYVERRCFSFPSRVIPYQGVVDLGKKTIETDIEVLTLTALSTLSSYDNRTGKTSYTFSCSQRRAAENCILRALTVNCLPIGLILNVTNVSATSKQKCFFPTPDYQMPSTATSTTKPNTGIRAKLVPTSPCMQTTNASSLFSSSSSPSVPFKNKLVCTEATKLKIIPAPIPSYLLMYILIAAGSFLGLLIITGLLCRFCPPIIAFYRNKKKLAIEEEKARREIEKEEKKERKDIFKEFQKGLDEEENQDEEEEEEEKEKESEKNNLLDSNDLLGGAGGTGKREEEYQFNSQEDPFDDEMSLLTKGLLARRQKREQDRLQRKSGLYSPSSTSPSSSARYGRRNNNNNNNNTNNNYILNLNDLNQEGSSSGFSEVELKSKPTFGSQRPSSSTTSNATMAAAAAAGGGGEKNNNNEANVFYDEFDELDARIKSSRSQKKQRNQQLQQSTGKFILNDSFATPTNNNSSFFLPEVKNASPTAASSYSPTTRATSSRSSKYAGKSGREILDSLTKIDLSEI